MGLETKYSLLKSWVFDGASGERASTDSGFFYFLVFRFHFEQLEQQHHLDLDRNCNRPAAPIDRFFKSPAIILAV